MTHDAGYTPGANAHRQPDRDAHRDLSVERGESIGELFADVSKDLSLLLRQEVELAKAEAKQTAGRAGKAAGMFGGAGYAGHLAVLFLSVSAWWAIGNETGRAWAALIVAGVWLLVAAVLAALGRANLKAVRGLPRTAETMKKIPDAAKGHEEAVR